MNVIGASMVMNTVDLAETSLRMMEADALPNMTKSDVPTMSLSIIALTAVESW